MAWRSLPGQWPRGSEDATRAYHEWLRVQVARNAPFDEIARALLTSSGKLNTNGPANDWIYALAIDARGAKLASGDWSGTVKLHDVPAK